MARSTSWQARRACALAFPAQALRLMADAIRAVTPSAVLRRLLRMGFNSAILRIDPGGKR